MAATQIKLQLRLNGKSMEIETYPMTRLIDVIRHELHLTGTKEGCGEGECGACSVLLEGDLVNSCLIPAAQAHNKNITTIEGIATAENLHDIQKAFLKYGGTQCGICTPGMVLAAYRLLQEYPHPSKNQIQKALSGNLCRCTGYISIFESVLKALQEITL